MTTQPIRTRVNFVKANLKRLCNQSEWVFINSSPVPHHHQGAEPKRTEHCDVIQQAPGSCVDVVLQSSEEVLSTILRQVTTGNVKFNDNLQGCYLEYIVCHSGIWSLLVRAVFNFCSFELLLYVRNSVIGLKTRATYSINQMQNQNQSWLGRTHFSALGTGYMYLLRVLIGSFCCLRLCNTWFYDTTLKTALIYNIGSYWFCENRSGKQLGISK